MPETDGNVLCFPQLPLTPRCSWVKGQDLVMATDENENVTPQDSSTSESDSDTTSEYDDGPLQYVAPAPVKKANKYHPLNWYTPTVLSPILDVSPSLESREAENNSNSTTTTDRNISDSYVDEATDKSITERDEFTVDATESELVSNALGGGLGTKLKRSPAIIDFSDPGKMSRSTGDLPDVEEAIVEDSSTDQSVSLMTKSESALRHNHDSSLASSTNLLFEEISVPFYFTLPPLYMTDRQQSSSMDDSLHRQPKPTQNRLSLVMSQILLKEELKEALCLQRSKLAECEIEADERAVKVQKKLEQSRTRKGSLGSRKVHAAPDRHVFDGRWCSEPSLVEDLKPVLKHKELQHVSVAVQTDPLLDLSQLGKTLPNGKKSPREVKRVKSSKSKKKTTVAVNTQITWRALQVPTQTSDKDKRQALSNFQGLSGITYGDLLDFSSTKRCFYCSQTKSQQQPSTDALYAYFQSTNPRRVALFNDYSGSDRSSRSQDYRVPSQSKYRRGRAVGECGVHKV